VQPFHIWKSDQFPATRQLPGPCVAGKSGDCSFSDTDPSLLPSSHHHFLRPIHAAAPFLLARLTPDPLCASPSRPSRPPRMKTSRTDAPPSFTQRISLCSFLTPSHPHARKSVVRSSRLPRNSYETKVCAYYSHVLLTFIFLIDHFAVLVGLSRTEGSLVIIGSGASLFFLSECISHSIFVPGRS